MSRQTEMAELTRIIECVQRLEYLKTLLAKGEKRTLDRRKDEWGAVRMAANAQLESWEYPIPSQPELATNEATPPSQ